MKKITKNLKKLNDSGGIMKQNSKDYKKLASISVNSRLRKSKNSGTILKFRHTGILTFAFFILHFAFAGTAFAQGSGNALDFDPVR